MRSISRRTLGLMAATWLASVQSFSTGPTQSSCSWQPRRRALVQPPSIQMTAPSDSENTADNQINNESKRSGQAFQSLRQAATRLKTPVALGLLSAAALDQVSSTGTPIFQFRPRAAEASAPVMAPPRRDIVDAETQAMFEVNKRISQKNEDEMKEFQKKAREIAASQGEAARAKFEKEWEADRQEKALEKAKGLESLKRELLDEGIDPWMDIEGQRQVMFFEKGVDLAEVPGTKYYMEKDFEKNQYKRSQKYQKQAHRFIIKNMVEDIKRRGNDPLEYFEKNKEKTADILNMSTKKAILLAEQYQANLKEYGQITKPKPGEALLPKLEPKETATMSKSETKEAAAKAKALAKEQKAKAKEEARRLKEASKKEKETAKALAKEQKAKAREEARRLKEEAKREKDAAKAAGAAAASAAAAGVSVATDAMGDAVGSAKGLLGTDSGEAIVSDGSSDEHLLDESAERGASAVSKQEDSKSSDIVKLVRESPAFSAATFVVTAGGGAFAIKKYQEKKARDEEERQRQFRLIMGDSEKANGDKGSKESREAEPSIDLDEDTLEFEEHSALEDSDGDDSTTAPEAPAPKKKKRGIRSMFGKKNANNREVDLNVLVAEDAAAPEFALLLAKILTFGAPGRFPRVTAMRGPMPMDEFDLDAAKEQLSDCGAASDITKEEAAEIFANVVNCMLIDIVDLASSTLKQKDDKATVDAINVVVDFMNHAASLYDSIAEGVNITPVTYGGTLAKSKLEQMYSTYSMSGMMSMDEHFNARVGLLQDVFSISEKRAEGIMMKAMQKNMMKMMKTGEGMEGMEEMMNAMGGMGGMEGMEGLMGLGEGEDGPNPEQLKEMLTTLKTMKDSGSIPPEELDAVRSQFREAFGSSIEEVMKDADKDTDALGETDKELLDLMKSILED